MTIPFRTGKRLFFSRLEEFPVAGFRSERFAVRSHQRSDVGKLIGHVLDRRRRGLRAFHTDQSEVRAEAFYFSSQSGLVEAAYPEADFHELRAGGRLRDVLSFEGIALANQERGDPRQCATLLGPADRDGNHGRYLRITAAFLRNLRAHSITPLRRAYTCAGLPTCKRRNRAYKALQGPGRQPARAGRSWV